MTYFQLPIQLHFNSIKVQLKLVVDGVLIAHHAYFNSIKVQLKRSIAHKFIVYCTFQFHKGTIKTLHPDLSSGVF